MKKYIAAILGGSGSVGQGVVRSLLKDAHCQSIILVSRRPLDKLVALDPSRIKVQICNPLDDLIKMASSSSASSPSLSSSSSSSQATTSSSSSSSFLSGTNIAFCTLGVGAPSQATKDEVLHIDCTIPNSFAQICSNVGVSHYCLMTATGADESATWSTITKTAAGGGWNRHVKGRIERLTSELNFPYLFIAQPAALLGSSHTPQIVNWMTMPINTILPQQYSSAHVDDIAKGMVRTTVNAYQSYTNPTTTTATTTGGEGGGGGKRVGEERIIRRIAGGIPISNAE